MMAYVRLLGLFGKTIKRNNCSLLRLMNIVIKTFTSRLLFVH